MTDKNKVNEVDLKAKVEPVVTEEVDQVRFNNDGYKVKLSFGDFRVRELSVFDLGAAIVEFFEAFQSISQFLDDDNDGNDFTFISKLLKNEEVKQQVAKVLALYCGTEDSKPFTKLGIKDFKILFKELKKVIHPEELRELFLELDLAKYLQPTNSTEQT